MKKRMMMVSYLALVLLAGIKTLSADIETGSGAGLVSATGGTISFSTTPALANCVLKSTGGTLSGAVTSSASTFTLPPAGNGEYTTFTTDGTVSLTSSTIALGNSQVVNVNGGPFSMTVTASGVAATPSVMEGFGQLSTVTAIADHAQLNLRWFGSYDANISLGCTTTGHTTKLYLENDLRFSPGYAVVCSSSSHGADNTVDCSGGYGVYMGGTPAAALSIADSQTWVSPIIHLTGPVTLAAGKTLTCSLGTYMALYGHGNIFTFGNNLSQIIGGGSTYPHILDDVIFHGVTSNSLSCSTEYADFQMNNVTLVDASGHSVTVTGMVEAPTYYVDFFSTHGANFASGNTWVKLNSDLAISAYWSCLNGSNVAIDGGGHTFNMYATSDGEAKFSFFGGSLSLSNIVLTEISKYSFWQASGSSTMYLSNVAWYAHSGSAIRVHGSPTPGAQGAAQLTLSSTVPLEAGDIFGDVNGVTWNNGVVMDLLSDSTLHGEWILGGTMIINGGGHVLTTTTDTVFSSAAAQTLSLNDLTLGGIHVTYTDAGPFQLHSGSTLSLNNVNWVDSNSLGIRISGKPTLGEEDTQAAASITLVAPDEGVNPSDIFTSGVTWTNGATIELLTDIVISGTWRFQDDTIIIGNGHSISITDGVFIVENSATLKLRDVIWSGVVTGSLVDADADYGTVDMRNVTMTLGGNVSWDSINTQFSIRGPLTVVTGNYTIAFNHDTALATHTTVYYDTLGGLDRTNVTGLDLVSSARVTWSDYAGGNGVGDIYYGLSSYILPACQFLAPASGGNVGHRMIFNYGGISTLDGEGRSIIFPCTNGNMDDEWCLQVAEGTTAVMQNVLLDGMKPNHLQLGGPLYFGSGACIRLRSDWTENDALAQTIQFGSSDAATGEAMILDLNGFAIDLSSEGAALAFQADDESSSRLTIKNGRLLGVSSSSISAIPSGAFFYVNNLDWYGSLGDTIHISADTAAMEQGGVQLTLAESSSGNIFGTNVTWNTGATIELLSDVNLNSTWKFSDDTTIIGNGFKMNLFGGALSIATGKTLQLRNVQLQQVVTGSIVDPSEAEGGTVDCADVTIVLNDSNVNWSSLHTGIFFSGPATIVTDTHTLTGSSASAIGGVTVYYDTLGSLDLQNVTGFTLEGDARIVWTDYVSSNGDGDITYAASAQTLKAYQFLSPRNGSSNGHRIFFNYAGASTLSGQGRALVFPCTTADMGTQWCINIAAGTTITTEDMLLDGFKPAHVAFGDGTAHLYFGKGTCVLLRSDLTGDDALIKTLQFGGSAEEIDESMLLDLNGMTIDMADTAAAIALQAGALSGSTLTLKNGRLMNLSGTKLSAPAGATLVLENMVLELSDDYTFADAALEIRGTCEVRGVSGKAFTYTSTDTLTINSDAHFRFADGITYAHNNEGTTNLILTDGTSSMEFIGATFTGSYTAEGPLVLTKGVLLADHNAALNPGTAGIQIGDNTSAANDLTLRLRPGATMTVGTGNLLYENKGG